jgi:hypothetical protein
MTEIHRSPPKELAWTLVPDKSKRKKLREQFLHSERKKPVSRRLFHALIKKHGFRAYPPYIDDIYDQYVKDEALLEAFNNWFFKGLKATKYFQDCLSYVQDNNENNIFLIWGIKRGGKSRVARHIALVGNRIASKHARYHHDPGDPDISNVYFMGKPFVAAPPGFDAALLPVADDYCTINFSQSQKVVPRMNAGNWLIQDEMPDSRGEGSRNILKDIKNLLKIASGKRRLNFVFLNPTIVEMDNVMLYIRIVAADKVRKRTLAILSAYTSSKPAILKTRGIIIFDVDEPIELWERYETASDNVKRSFQEKSGSSLVEANLNLVQDIVNSVTNMTDEQRDIIGETIKIKEAFNAWLDIDPDLMEAANSPRRTSIAALAYNKYKNLLDEEKESKKGTASTGTAIKHDHEVDAKGRFIWDQYECLKKQFVDTNIVSERDLDIYWYGEHEGKRADAIKRILNLKMGRPRITQIKAEVYEKIGHEGNANKLKGAEYELYLEPILKERYPGWKVYHGGKEGELDFLISHSDNKAICVSAKVSDKLDRRIYYTPDECGPEIKMARQLAEEGKTASCLLNVYDVPTLTMHEQAIPFNENELPKNFIFDLPLLESLDDEEPAEPEDPGSEDPVEQE